MTHVSAGYNPVLDGDVFGVPCISSICIHRAPLRIRRSVHVEVGHSDVLRMRNKCMPGVLSAYVYAFCRTRRLIYALTRTEVVSK